MRLRRLYVCGRRLHAYLRRVRVFLDGVSAYRTLDPVRTSSYDVLLEDPYDAGRRTGHVLTGHRHTTNPGGFRLSPLARWRVRTDLGGYLLVEPRRPLPGCTVCHGTGGWYIPEHADDFTCPCTLVLAAVPLPVSVLAALYRGNPRRLYRRYRSSSLARRAHRCLDRAMPARQPAAGPGHRASEASGYCDEPPF